MSRQRIMIAVVAFVVILSVLWVDWRLETPLGSLALLTILGGLAQAEIYPLLRRTGLDASAGFGVAAAVFLLLWRGLGTRTGLPDPEVRAFTMVFFAFFAAVPFVAAMLKEGAAHRDGREEFLRAAGTLTGLLLVWFQLSFLLELRLLDGGAGTTRVGLEWTLLLVLCVKMGDSAAYLVGRSVGVTPLSWVSPKKTWEGAAASVAGGVAVSILFGLPFGLRLWHLAVFGVLTNVAGQIGDLVESLVKRRAGVKDSGVFFREIGGFLDLMDSLLLAGPVAYLFVRSVVL